MARRWVVRWEDGFVVSFLKRGWGCVRKEWIEYAALHYMPRAF
jgi:hypothetical protein